MVPIGKLEIGGSRIKGHLPEISHDKFTLLLHKDPVELPGCPYKEPIYSLLMIPFKSHH